MDPLPNQPTPPVTTPTTPDLIPQSPKKTPIWLFAAIGVGLVIVTSILAASLLSREPSETSQNDIQSVPTESQPIPTRDFTGNWKEYKNAKYSFLIKYPQELNFSINHETTPRSLIEGISEGAFFSKGDQSFAIVAGTVSDYYKAFPLAKIVQTGSLINSCYEDQPAQTEDFVSANGDKGIKAWYWIQSGCQGSTERIQSSAHIFFYQQEETTTIVEITSEGLDESINQVASTFRFMQ